MRLRRAERWLLFLMLPPFVAICFLVVRGSWLLHPSRAAGYMPITGLHSGLPTSIAPGSGGGDPLLPAEVWAGFAPPHFSAATDKVLA